MSRRNVFELALDERIAEHRDSYHVFDPYMIVGKPHDITRLRPADSLELVITQANRIVVGKEREIRLALTCLLAGGHLLVEDVPGVGKTTLARTLAAVLGLSFRRIQFTNDLLPADILGVSVYDREAHAFEFQPGPIFAEIVLADEVNRATPKTQSALLEAMAEHQVTLDGETRALPAPFFVIATQNPVEQVGTFPLPESQLDRFLMRIRLGYPSADAERALLKGADRQSLLETLEPGIRVARLREIQNTVEAVHVSDAIVDYVYAIVAYTRQNGDFETPLSPRAGLALLSASKAWALLGGRDYLVPEDVQAVLENVVSHRLISSERSPQGASSDLAQMLLSSVPLP